MKPHTEIEPPAGFSKESINLLEQQVLLSVDEIKHLIMMTPFGGSFARALAQIEQQGPQSNVIVLCEPVCSQLEVFFSEGFIHFFEHIF